MSSVPGYFVLNLASGGERAATHPALTILIGIGVVVAFYVFMRFVEAQDRRDRGR